MKEIRDLFPLNLDGILNYYPCFFVHGVQRKILNLLASKKLSVIVSKLFCEAKVRGFYPGFDT